MKLFVKGLLLIALPASFQLIGLLFLFKVQADAANADFWAAHSKQVLAAANRLEIPVLTELAEARRGVVLMDPSLTGSDAFWADLYDRHANLQQLVSDNIPQQEAVKKMKQPLDDFHKWSLEVAARIKSGSVPAAQEKVTDGSGKASTDDFLAQMDSFLTEERRLDAQRTVEAASARQQQEITLIVVAVVALAASGIAAYLFTRSVAARLAILTANAARLAEGGRLAEPVHGKDEIALLDRTLHVTSERLAAADRAEAQFKADLEKRAAQLADVNEHLRQQTQDNEMFIYSVSHDLRSPLVNLQGFSKELGLVAADIRSEIDSSDLPENRKVMLRALIDKDMNESLRFLQTAVGRAAGIIDALLRLSRAGRVEYRREPVDVAAIARRVVDAMSGSIKEKNVTVTLADLPRAAGDPTAIEQIFGNLIGNAVNYLDPSRPGKIEIGSVPDLTAATPTHTYFVKDNGLGIPAAYMAKMFRAFQRLHGDVAKGEGVGLALVRRVVERLGGKVWIESQEGAGTTFFVALPAVDRHPSPSPDEG